MTRTGAVVARLVVLLGLIVVAFVLLQEPVRQAETRAATWLLQLGGMSGVRLSSGSSVVVLSSQGSFQAIVTPSCSSLASVLAIACLSTLAPGYGGWRKLAASTAAIATVALGNVLRIAASLAVGLWAGRSSLVLFHDSIGNVFSFAYTLGGYILMLWLLLPTGDEHTLRTAHAAP